MRVNPTANPNSARRATGHALAPPANRRPELAAEELYCCDAQWSGFYDRMHPHEPDEIERRLALAADFGEAAYDSRAASPHERIRA